MSQKITFGLSLLVVLIDYSSQGLRVKNLDSDSLERVKKVAQVACKDTSEFPKANELISCFAPPKELETVQQQCRNSSGIVTSSDPNRKLARFCRIMNKIQGEREEQSEKTRDSSSPPSPSTFQAKGPVLTKKQYEKLQLVKKCIKEAISKDPGLREKIKEEKISRKSKQGQEKMITCLEAVVKS